MLPWGLGFFAGMGVGAGCAAVAVGAAEASTEEEEDIVGADIPSQDGTSESEPEVETLPRVSARPWRRTQDLPPPPTEQMKFQGGAWVANEAQDPGAKDAEQETIPAKESVAQEVSNAAQEVTNAAPAAVEWHPPSKFDLRWCYACRSWSYLRKKACVNSECASQLQ